MKIKPKRTFITKGTGSFLMKSFVFLACFLLASTISIYAQTKNVTGTITDVTNESLIGVSVKIKGTTTGTVTDIDGAYSISAETGDVLEYSFVGMKPQSITVGAQNTINVVLEDAAHELTTTVVIGYGSAKKADLTGAIGSVSADVITKQPALNALQSVQGKMTGVNIISNDNPGSTPTVVIRGLGTALGGRDPLYVVDGFPVDNIQNISSADILSINVLKDASSASIYGVRAANGVILITTKRGQEGTTKIGVESYVGIKNVLKKVKMANASQYIEYFNENQRMLEAYGVGNTYELKKANEQAYNTDWYDELLHTGVFTNHVVSMSGGSKNVDYYLSYNYYDEDGLLEGQNYQRSTIRNNNVYKFFNNRLKFSQNLNISFSKAHPKPHEVFNEAYRQSPLVPVKYSNGRWGTPLVNTNTGIVGYEGGATDNIGSLNSMGNPLNKVARTNEKAKTLTLQGGFEGEFKLTDFLKVNSRFGATKYYSKNRQFIDVRDNWLALSPLRTNAEFDALKAKESSDLQYADNSLKYEDIETFRWVWEGFATFNKSFDKHNIEAVVGLSREKMNIGSKSILTGYEVPAKKQYWNLNNVSGDYPNQVSQYNYTPRALASYFGRLQYNFDNKYYFTGTIRRDGSSTFRASGDYWGTFPSLGIGWTISKENFMSDVKFLDYLKLRANWGELGNQNVPPIVWSARTSNGLGDYTNVNTVFGDGQELAYGAAFGSPVSYLSWEVTREWGIGADFSMLNDRLTGGIDYYNKTNTNLILDVVNILNSPYEGNYYAHGGKVRNTGVEFGLGWSDKLANGLTYDISANYSYNKNEIIDVRPAFDGRTGGSPGDHTLTKRLLKGQSIYSWWLFETDGVWQTQEEIDNPDIAKFGSPKPGHLKYKDQNGDGVIDDRDKKFFGSYLPTSNYALHLGLGYKNFDFNVDGYGVAGNKIYNGLKHGRVSGGENITYDTYKDRWTGAGSTNAHPGANRDSESSSYFLEDGSFFRINNITLGYTFNNLVFNGSKLRFYLTAQNPFMFTNYSGFTPEVSSDGSPSGTTGIETSAYPTTRSFIFGLNLQF